ncbi:MAG TPA: hypothetical protein VFZ53_17635, partial [Polyangiaceae bacterium]
GAHFDGIVYHPSLAPSEMPAADERTASYVLIDLFEAGGLWERRDDPKLFIKHGSFAGDRGGRCGSGGILCTVNAANAPWGWDDGDDGSVKRGSIAGDPAKLVARYFRTPEAVSERYTYNPYRPGAERSTAPLVAQARRIPGSERVSAAGPAENGRRFTGRLAPRGP